MEEKFLNNEICYHTNDFEPNRLTLIFIHGIAGSLSIWSRYEERFKNEYNILTYDIRGHGKSRRFLNYDDYKIENFREDLQNLIEHLNIKNYILIGHSFGVFISLSFISKYKDNIKGLILLSPSYMGGRIPSIQNYKLLLDILIKVKFPINTNKERIHINYPKSIHSLTKIIFAIKEVFNTGIEVYLYFIKRLLSLNFKNVLGEIMTPTLIISGKNDEMIPVKHARMMDQKIPNSKIIEIKNGDHQIAINNFELVSEEIEDFVHSIK